MTQPLWNRSIISPGGTVIAGALDHAGTLLAATPAGIFRYEAGARWLPLPDQPTIPFPQAFIAADRYLLLGGGDVILFSADNGAIWKRGQTLALEQPVTCLVTAPNFAESRVVLAGSDGAGVLRSTDGGRIWQYASFGLQDFSITALAAAPCWDDREAVFAATLSGLYRSPNGGRAWKPANCGLEGCIVLSLAVGEVAVFAGTEAHGIYRSTDSGATWQPCPFPMAEPPAINALWHLPGSECLLAGTDNGQIWRSPDAGDTWARCAAASDSVLCFFGDADCLYAGTADAGLLASDDAGQSWHAGTLAARAFTSLHSGADGALFACGAVEGVWSSGGGDAWQSVGDFELLLLTAGFPDDPRGVRFAATAQGLLRADNTNPEWQPVLPAPDITTIFPSPAFAQDGRVWVGTWGGDLYTSEDGGVGWQAFPAPPAHSTVVQLGMAAGNLLAITYKPETQILTLWRFVDGRWQVWLEAPAPTPNAQIADADGETFVSLGTRCFCWTEGQWQGILKTDKPILRLRRWHDGLLALTANQFIHSPDRTNWTTLHLSPDNSLHDFALIRQPDAVCLLARGGVLLHSL